MNLELLLTLLGIIFLGFAAFGVPAWRSFSWGWLGAFILAIVLLF